MGATLQQIGGRADGGTVPLTGHPRLRRHRDAAGRPRKRHSVLVHLLALAVVPALGLPVFAGLFAQDKLEEADAARRIGRSMDLAIELDDLRVAAQAESASSAVEFFAALYDLSTEQIDEALGQELSYRSADAEGTRIDARCGGTRRRREAVAGHVRVGAGTTFARSSTAGSTTRFRGPSPAGRSTRPSRRSSGA